MLTIDTLNQYYGGSHTLRGISLELPAGKVTTLLGRNGVGKTTLSMALRLHADPAQFLERMRLDLLEKLRRWSAVDMQRWLNDWILNYVDGDPSISSDETKAKRPLAGAEVVVEEVEGNPGYYTSKFFLRPHYQLEGLTVSLRLVSKLPSQKAA